MAHISRASRRKLDPEKVNDARFALHKQHCESLVRGIAEARRGTAASAYKQMQSDPNNKKMGQDWKFEGSFTYAEFVFCKMQYGEDFINDPDFMNFWRKANDQEYLKFA